LFVCSDGCTLAWISDDPSSIIASFVALLSAPSSGTCSLSLHDGDAEGSSDSEAMLDVGVGAVEGAVL
jgi:hypothetical protein